MILQGTFCLQTTDVKSTLRFLQDSKTRFVQELTRKFCSLTKECPWAEHLTSPSKRGVGTLSSVSTLEHPCHVYSDLMLSM